MTETKKRSCWDCSA